MSRWKYTGETPATYPAYLDKEAGVTLVAEPGQVYDIAPAEGSEWVVQPEGGGQPVTKTLPIPPPGPWEREKTTTTTAAASSSDKKDKE